MIKQSGVLSNDWTTTGTVNDFYHGHCQMIEWPQARQMIEWPQTPSMMIITGTANWLNDHRHVKWLNDNRHRQWWLSRALPNDWMTTGTANDQMTTGPVFDQTFSRQARNTENPPNVVCVGLARTVYIHRIWPYIWWFPCQKYRIHTVYIWFWPTLCICHMQTSEPFLRQCCSVQHRYISVSQSVQQI
jgi:hypothetical protein